MYMLYKGKEGVPFASSDIRFKDQRIDESDRFIGPGYYESKTFVDNLAGKPSTNTVGFNTKDSRF